MGKISTKLTVRPEDLFSPSSADAEEWLDESHFVFNGLVYEIDIRGIIEIIGSKEESGKDEPSQAKRRPGNPSQIR